MCLLIHAQASDARSATGSSLDKYESPLQYFHAYRFHPQFQDAVPGGLRSLTYSNRIDVNKEICPHELDGEVCPDGRSCEYQHFDSMGVPGKSLVSVHPTLTTNRSGASPLRSLTTVLATP